MSTSGVAALLMLNNGFVETTTTAVYSSAPESSNNVVVVVAAGCRDAALLVDNKAASLSSSASSFSSSSSLYLSSLGASADQGELCELFGLAHTQFGKDGDEAAPVSEEEAGVTCNMVAAMNEHLSSSSTTNSIRSTATSVAKEKLIKDHPRPPNQQQHHQTKDNNKLQHHHHNNQQQNNNSGGVAGGKVEGIFGFPCDFDHMYASMTDGGAPATATSALGVSPLRGNDVRQNDLTEVKHLKELLLLHLDLIQQQSEQIVTKDKLLAALRSENETLKLRLERMDRRVSLKMRSDTTENSLDHTGPCSPPSLSASLNSLPSTSENTIKNSQSDSLSPQYGESFKIRLNTSGGVTTVKQELSDKVECKQETMGESWENKKKRKSDPNSSVEGVSKRKRGVSSSSTVSNETTSTITESQGDKGLGLDNSKKSEKKNKSLAKRESFLGTQEHYYTAMGNSNFALTIKDKTTPDSTSSNLEVPMWRVKVYTSCYTMEGTENLDDEIFNKRHLKLENDERRRKRWDVQRIREQRHIEKLKLRQERQTHHSACLNLNHTGPCLPSVEEEPVTTLWADADQVQFIFVGDELPVCAFGACIPSFNASDFDLPWLVNSKLKTRRPKRLDGRRRKSSRR